MLNKKGQRELAYVVRIDEICAIEGADRVEVAKVGGWRIMVRKGQFLPGDLAVYFEIDSKVPEKEPFLFLESKHYKVKTQKYFKGTVISQGLLMAAEDFGWEKESLKLGDFLTENWESLMQLRRTMCVNLRLLTLIRKWLSATRNCFK